MASFRSETSPVVTAKTAVARTETLSIDEVLKGNDRLPRNAATIDIDVFGGQGSINVPSWSPDSMKFAYVEFPVIPERIAWIS